MPPRPNITPASGSIDCSPRWHTSDVTDTARIATKADPTACGCVNEIASRKGTNRKPPPSPVKLPATPTNNPYAISAAVQRHESFDARRLDGPSSSASAGAVGDVVKTEECGRDDALKGVFGCEAARSPSPIHGFEPYLTETTSQRAGGESVALSHVGYRAWVRIGRWPRSESRLACAVARPIISSHETKDAGPAAAGLDTRYGDGPAR